MTFLFLVLVSIRVSAQKLVYKNRETRISMLPIWIHTDNNLNLLRIRILSNHSSKFVEVEVVHCFSYLWNTSGRNKTESRINLSQRSGSPVKKSSRVMEPILSCLMICILDTLILATDRTSMAIILSEKTSIQRWHNLLPRVDVK